MTTGASKSAPHYFQTAKPASSQPTDEQQRVKLN